MAAGRRTSVDTSSGWRPCRVSHVPSFPAVVVLPEPWRPSSRITRGDFDRGLQPARRVAEQRDHLVAHDPHDLLRRREAAQHVLPDRAVADAVDERLDDLEVDVGLEQRHADLAQRGLDRGLRQARLAPEGAEHVLQAVLRASNMTRTDRGPTAVP